MKLPEEIETEIQKEVEKLGKGDKNDQGLISWEFYIKAKEVVEQIAKKVIEVKSAEFTINRRTLLQQQKMQEYSQTVGQ